MVNNTQKQASEFDNFAYNIAPQFEDGFYGYAVDKDFSMSIIQMYLDCETEEDEKKVDRALRKLRNFHLSMDRGHLKNKSKYLKEEAIENKSEDTPVMATRADKQEHAELQTRPTRATKADSETPTSIAIAAEEAQKPDNRTHEEYKPVLEVTTYRVDDEKAIAMKRLVGLTGLKRAAMAAAIERYFKDRQTFQDAYKDDPGMKFAYTLDDYLNGARYNIE